MSENLLWGIDLGGTKIEAVILDVSKAYDIVHRQRRDTEAQHGYEHVLENIKLLIEDISRQTGLSPTRLGIGTPGSLNPHNGLLRNCNSVYLNGRAFKKDLENHLDLDVRMTNDANCFAVSEFKLGVIQEKFPDARVVFGIIMGTGVGSGLIVDGKIIEGRNNIGGEWGHIFLDDSGGKCYCGKIGCVETVISGPALERYYKSISGESLKLKKIVEHYREGKNAHARKTMERLFQFFPKAISNLINIVDPDVFVMGGGLGNIDELYTEGLKQLPDFVFSDYIETQFTRPRYGDSSGVLGAALLWED